MNIGRIGRVMAGKMDIQLLKTNTMTEEQIKLIKGLYRKPFNYDDYGQMIFDADNKHVLDIRGWGAIKYLPEAKEKQDTFGRFVCHLLNQYNP
jgi:hypothetical protein